MGPFQQNVMYNSWFTTLFLQEWGVLTEKPDWVFGAELVCCGSELYTIGGVSSRQVDRYGHGLINYNYN